MKRFIFLLTLFGLLANSLSYSNAASSLSYDWEKVSTDSSGNFVYIAPKTVVNVNNLIKFKEPYFQVLVKTNIDVLACAFRMHNGVKYFCALPINNDVDKLLNLPSVATQMRKVYEQMLDRDVAPHMARAVAESYHDEFRENNIKQLVEGIRIYGLNSDSSLNPIGVYLLFKLVNESPQHTAQLLQTLPFSTNFAVVSDISMASMIYDEAFRYALLPRK